MVWVLKLRLFEFPVYSCLSYINKVLCQKRLFSYLPFNVYVGLGALAQLLPQ